MSDIDTSLASPAGAIGCGVGTDVVDGVVMGGGSSIVTGSDVEHAAVIHMARIPKVSRRSTPPR